MTDFASAKYKNTDSSAIDLNSHDAEFLNTLLQYAALFSQTNDFSGMIPAQWRLHSDSRNCTGGRIHRRKEECQ
jgi:hypothetical protein